MSIISSQRGVTQIIMSEACKKATENVKASSSAELQPVLFAYDARFGKGHSVPDHPEQPSRVGVCATRLKESGLWEKLHHVRPREASREELELCHTKAHLSGLDCYV